jgi:nitrate reductase gamma subunit
MQDYILQLLFTYFPYMAGAVFLAGLVYRVATDGKDIQALSTQFFSNDKLLTVGSRLFHYGVVFVFFGHIFGLLLPEWSYDWLITNEQKRVLAIVMGGAFGLTTFGGILMLLLRRFSVENVRKNSSTMDIAIVVLITFQILTGLLGTCETIRHDLDHYMNLDRWAQGLCVFLPDSWQYLTGATLVHQIHIFFGFLIVMIFPFTKLMHMVALPFRYLVEILNPKRW